MPTSQSILPIGATEALLDAINRAVELEGDNQARIAFLLQALQRLMRRDSRCALWLLEDLGRDPAPSVLTRIIVYPTNSTEPVSSIEDAQRAFDEAAPVTRHMLREVLATLRTPSTRILSEVSEPGWLRDVLVRQHLAAIGTVDGVISMWSSSRDHAVFLIVHRRASDPPFTREDAALVSLMLRSIAPFADRELARRAERSAHADLSQREREVLLMLLAGDSEKQIAAALHRSVNTVHTFVKQIYRRFSVSSRGELMAQFVDRTVLESLRGSDQQ